MCWSSPIVVQNLLFITHQNSGQKKSFNHFLKAEQSRCQQCFHLIFRQFTRHPLFHLFLPSHYTQMKSTNLRCNSKFLCKFSRSSLSISLPQLRQETIDTHGEPRNMGCNFKHSISSPELCKPVLRGSFFWGTASICKLHFASCLRRWVAKFEFEKCNNPKMWFSHLWLMKAFDNYK